MNWRVIEVCTETGVEEVVSETRWKSEALSQAEVFTQQSGMFGVRYVVRYIPGGFR